MFVLDDKPALDPVLRQEIMELRNMVLSEVPTSEIQRDIAKFQYAEQAIETLLADPNISPQKKLALANLENELKNDERFLKEEAPDTKKSDGGSGNSESDNSTQSSSSDTQDQKVDTKTVGQLFIAGALFLTPAAAFAGEAAKKAGDFLQETFLEPVIGSSAAPALKNMLDPDSPRSMGAERVITSARGVSESEIRAEYKEGIANAFAAAAYAAKGTMAAVNEAINWVKDMTATATTKSLKTTMERAEATPISINPEAAATELSRITGNFAQLVNQKDFPDIAMTQDYGTGRFNSEALSVQAPGGGRQQAQAQDNSMSRMPAAASMA